MLLIYDKSNNRFKEIHTNPDVTIDTVNTMRSQTKHPKYRQVYAGEIIKDFVEESENNRNDDDDDDVSD